LLLGDFDVNCSILFRNGNFSEKAVFSSYAFYIQDGEDKILVDTGFGDSRFCIEKLGREVRPNEKTLSEHLESLKVSPENITTLILTHCHWDHIGGLNMFKNAKIYCQSTEISWSICPPIWAAQSYASLFSHFIFEARDRLVLIDGDYLLTERIKLKKVAGHSPGSQIIEAKGEKKDIIIAGDALFYFDNLDKNIPNGESFSLNETIYTLQYFRNRILEKPGTVVLPGHDPKLWDKYKKRGFLEI
jgi:glyoxylase-like metal-dependent hydrolase (beta-lactamase superfamily II)